MALIILSPLRVRGTEREKKKGGGARGMFQTGYSSFVLVSVIVVDKVEIAL